MALTVSIIGVEGSKSACKLQLYICFRVYNLFAMKVVFSMDFYIFFWRAHLGGVHIFEGGLGGPPKSNFKKKIIKSLPIYK